MRTRLWPRRACSRMRITGVMVEEFRYSSCWKSITSGLSRCSPRSSALQSTGSRNLPGSRAMLCPRHSRHTISAVSYRRSASGPSLKFSSSMEPPNLEAADRRHREHVLFVHVEIEHRLALVSDADQPQTAHRALQPLHRKLLEPLQIGLEGILVAADPLDHAIQLGQVLVRRRVHRVAHLDHHIARTHRYSDT